MQFDQKCGRILAGPEMHQPQSHRIAVDIRRTSDRHILAPMAMQVYAWAIVLIVLLVRIVRTYYANVLHGHLSDFGRMYYAVLSWRAGVGLYAPNMATPEAYGATLVEMANLTSPQFHLAVWPFTYLPPSIAFGLWVLFNISAWAFSLRICFREWRVTAGPAEAATMALVIATSTVTAGAFETGQYVGLLMVPATLAWRSARQGYWTSSGAWLGLLSSMKPFALIFIAWLIWRRRWRAAGAAFFTMAASFACGAAIFGTGIYQQWQSVLANHVPTWGWLYVNASASAPWARAFAPSPVFQHISSPLLAVSGPLVCSALIATVTAWRLRRNDDTDLVWAILWTAALLISPLGWTYYLWWTTGPLGAAILHGWRHRPALRWPLVAIAACFVLPLNITIIGQPSIVASLTIGSIYTWALFAAWIGAVTDHRLSIAAISEDPPARSV